MVIAILAVWVIPHLTYVFFAFDRHYFGWFDKLEPRPAFTTVRQRYYAEHGIPYVTSQNVTDEYRSVAMNRSLGLPAHFEINHKQHYTFTNGVKKVGDKLRQWGRRLAQTKAGDKGAAAKSAAGASGAGKAGAPPSTAYKKKQFKAVYPDPPFLPRDKLHYGWFLIYLAGKSNKLYLTFFNFYRHSLHVRCHLSGYAELHQSGN